jgi:hypothetical protein
MRPAPWCLAAMLAAPCAAPAMDGNGCAATLADLRVLAGDPAFASTWQETTMRDGKPLQVTLHEESGGLRLAFVKAGEGLWAESRTAICGQGASLQARFTAEQIRLGPAAGWLVRTVLRRGGHFTLTRTGRELKIATTGWGGTFVPVTAASPPS